MGGESVIRLGRRAPTGIDTLGIQDMGFLFLSNRNCLKCGGKRTFSSLSWALNLADSLCPTVGLKADIFPWDTAVLAAHGAMQSSHASWEWV